jgi:hypothetical protein
MDSQYPGQDSKKKKLGNAQTTFQGNPMKMAMLTLISLGIFRANTGNTYYR